jgi:hypothetical protein
MPEQGVLYTLLKSNGFDRAARVYTKELPAWEIELVKYGLVPAKVERGDRAGTGRNGPPVYIIMKTGERLVLWDNSDDYAYTELLMPGDPDSMNWEHLRAALKHWGKPVQADYLGALMGEHVTYTTPENMVPPTVAALIRRNII